MKHTVIVTGGTKGLGREISLAFATTGCFVIALYANDEKAARELEERFAAEGLAGCAIRHDVTNEGGQAWSRPEIQEARELTVIHCACASFVPTPMHLLKWTDFERQMAVALRGALGAFQALLRPMLKKDRATWVNVLTTAL